MTVVEKLEIMVPIMLSFLTVCVLLLIIEAVIEYAILVILRIKYYHFLRSEYPDVAEDTIMKTARRMAVIRKRQIGLNILKTLNLSD